MSGAYYNEIDKFAAQWLRNLIAAGLIAQGEVDERSIEEVQPQDLRGFTQCHFFAGIGGWSYALRLAGWPDDRPVWTGSCPCQPLSCAGQRKGHADRRHLWPAFHRLISECKPPVVFGEQVASKDGREWFAGVRADLEAVGYACGASDLCAAGVGAPHLRQRLYWLAHTSSTRPLPSTYGEVCCRQESAGAWDVEPERHNSSAGLVNSSGSGLEEQRSEYRPSGERCSGLIGFAVQTGVPSWNGPTVAIECSDGWRRASSQPNAFPMAHGVSKRMGKLRGSGNAIVPPLAQAFIEAYMEIDQ